MRFVVCVSSVFIFLSCLSKDKNVLNNNHLNFEENSQIDFEVSRDSCEFEQGELLSFIGQIEDNYLLTLIGDEWEKSWEIYHSANDYKDEALSLIVCDNFSELNRNKVIHLMNGMGFDNYMEFVYDSYDLFCKSKISKKDLKKIIFNGWGRRCYLSKYHKESEVVLFLNEVKCHNIMNQDLDFIEYVDEILSGEDWEERLYFHKISPATGYNPDFDKGW